MTGSRAWTHPAVRGFDRAASAYERARPGYPSAAVRLLGRAFGLGPGRTIVELASGTGKFTRALRPLGATLVAIEPTPGMRAIFERMVPDVAVLDGTAEAIPLPDGFADAVVIAQAFHWFRPRPAIREIARVVRPGGGLGLIWNTRDDTDPLSARITEIVGRYRGSSPRSPRSVGRSGPGGEGRWRSVFDRAPGPFSPLRHVQFRFVQRLTPTQVVDRVLSVSFVAVQPADERRRIEREVRGFLADRSGIPFHRPIRLPYRSDLYYAQRRP
ncbi:MAG: class I SAM-dependent methyltransferase [Thermoplasmata archaeon]